MGLSHYVAYVYVRARVDWNWKELRSCCGIFRQGTLLIINPKGVLIEAKRARQGSALISSLTSRGIVIISALKAANFPTLKVS